jgi:hypothetical protein
MSMLGTLGHLGGLGGLGKDMQALSALQQIEKDVTSGNFANIGNSLSLLKGKAAAGGCLLGSGSSCCFRRLPQQPCVDPVLHGGSQGLGTGVASPSCSFT